MPFDYQRNDHMPHLFVPQVLFHWLVAHPQQHELICILKLTETRENIMILQYL